MDPSKKNVSVMSMSVTSNRRMEALMRGSSLLKKIHFVLPPKPDYQGSHASIYFVDKQCVKVHTSLLAFCREVFWYLTLRYHPKVLKMEAFDPSSLTLVLPRCGPSTLDPKDHLWDVSGIKHNQEDTSHWLVHPATKTPVLVDWSLATFASFSSLTLGFFRCELDCPWHGDRLCLAEPYDSDRRCTLDLPPSAIKKDLKIAVCWRGMVKGTLAKGTHATPYSSSTSECKQANQAMTINALHPYLLTKSLRAIRQAKADVFVHGWFTKEEEQEALEEELARALSPSAFQLEPLDKDFSLAYEPLLKDEDKIAKEIKTFPLSTYVHLLPSSLQRWFSTWYSFAKAYGLIEDSSFYDLVVIHRPDMVIPENLDYRCLSTTAITILMHQDPNGYSSLRPGYHDWFLAGPPYLMAKVAQLYDSLVELFGKAPHPEERSSHVLLRRWCETHHLPVTCLHYTQVRKVDFVSSVSETKTLRKEMRISSVQPQDTLERPSIDDQRSLSLKTMDKLMLSLEGPFCVEVVTACLPLLPGLGPLLEVHYKPGLLRILVGVERSNLSWDLLEGCLSQWRTKPSAPICLARSFNGKTVQTKVLKEIP